MKPGVFITFDVECSLGGAHHDRSLRPVPPSRAVWGEYGDRRFGLPLIVEILEQHGLAATFFVEALMKEQGFPDAPVGICEYLLDHGQDVQLHIHPNRMYYAVSREGGTYPRTDIIADLSSEQQLALLQEGSERLERWTGNRPIAFRAGNMGASEETLRQLEVVGITIDSSYTFPYVGGECRFAPQEPFNGSKWYGRVLELALTGFYQRKLPLMHPAKKVDPVGVSFAECRDAIQATCGAGAETVLILHSFSLFKWRNRQYDGGRLNRIVANRFRRTCHWLADQTEHYPVRTCRELAAAIEAGSYEAKAVPPCKIDRPARAVLRKAVQAWNNLYWT